MSESKRIIIALFLSIGVIFIWQKFFMPTVSQEIVQVQKEKPKSSIEQKTEVGKETGSIEPVEKKEVKKEVFTLEGNGGFYRVDSSLGFLDVKTDIAKFDFDGILGAEQKPKILFKFSDSLGFEVLDFETISESSQKLILENKKYSLTAIYEINKNGMLGLSLNSSHAFEMKFYIYSSEGHLEQREMRSFVALTKSLERIDVGDKEKIVGSTRWFGLDFNYHLFAISWSSKKNMVLTAFEKGLLQVETKDLFAGEENYNINLKYVFSLKDYGSLGKLGDNLELGVDFGIWSVLAVPMLKALQFFYQFLKNWGLAIILLTLCMRLLTFPLQYKSYKSMKRMQVIQPKLKALNERYKDDAQKKQLETMALFKREGVNPLGGCLPMFLQFPIFIAFYRMLGGAVELVGAPFFGWMNDLSQKDPYYVMPVLVTLVMFLQQKMTPTTTADPMQKKVMMFMPLIFGFILKDLPSALNLYIFVSTLLGIVMQKIVYANMDNQKKA